MEHVSESALAVQAEDQPSWAEIVRHAEHGESVSVIAQESVGPVHLVISTRISPEHARIKLTATHEHGVLVEVITVA
jgi:hypothetical protein